MGSINLDSISQLSEQLILPIIILFLSVTIGIAINRKLNEKIQMRAKTLEPGIKEIFFRAMQGTPISLCLVIGIYWIVNTSKLDANIA